MKTWSWMFILMGGQGFMGLGSVGAQEETTLTVTGTGIATTLPDHVQQGFALTCAHPDRAQAEALCQQQAEALTAKIQELGVAKEAVLVKQFPAIAVAGPPESTMQYQASAFLAVTLPINPETIAATLETLVRVKQEAAKVPDVTQHHLTGPWGDYPHRILLADTALHPQSALTGLAWFLADGTALEAEALRKAQAQSREKAQQAAAALGWQIGGLKNLTVGDSLAPLGAMNSLQPGRPIAHYEEMELALSVTVTATYRVQMGES